MPKLNVVLDATMFDLLQLCPARFNYRFNFNKVPQKKAKPLDRGTLVHCGMEEYFKALEAKDSFNVRVARAVQAIQQASMESELEMEETSRIIDVVRETLIVHRNEDETFDIIAVENAFSYALYEDDNIKIVMIGKIDLLVNKPGYENLPIDHKSYDRDFPVKRLNNQFTNYAVACNSNYLQVNRIGFQTSLSPLAKHKRVMLTYDDLFKEQWKQNVISIVHQYIDYAADNNWPMNLTSCDKFNRACEYLEVCDSSGQESKTFKLEHNFNVAQKWDVSSTLKLKDRAL